LSKLNGPRADRDITTTPSAGQAPAAAPVPHYQPPAQPIRAAAVPDSPLAVAMDGIDQQLAAVTANGPCPPLDSSSDDDGLDS